jgi:multiple sugar transport system substrate-binding protein
MSWKLSGGLSAILSVALILAACGPAATPTPAPKPTAAPTTAPTAQAAPTTAAAALSPAATPAGAPTKPADPTKPAAAATKPAEAAKPAAGGARVKLSFMGAQSPTNQAAWDAMLKEYQKLHPEIEVEFDLVPFVQLFPKIQAAAAAKTPVDIILADGPVVWFYALNNAIAPLDEYFPKDYVDRSYAPSSLATSYFRGKFYAPPMGESCSLMWFNTELTDRAGIKPPTRLAESWTTDQALEAWQKTNAPPNVYGVRWGQGTNFGDYELGVFRRSAGAKDSPTFRGIGEDGVTLSGHFDTPEAIKGHQFVNDLYQKHKVSPAEPIPDAFFTRRVAFYVGPESTVGQINRQYPDGSFKFAVTGTPYMPGGTQLCHTDSWHYSVGANSVHKKEAAELIKWMSGQDGAKIHYDITKAMPAHQAVMGSVTDYQSYPKQLVIEQFRVAGTPRILTPGYSEYQSLFEEFGKNLAQGAGIDVADLARQTARRMDGALAKYKGWNTR